MKFGDLLRDMPKKLKISPVAMIPHKSRQYRAILDLSFNLKMSGKKMSSVNDGTVPTAPQHSMDELGRVLDRMISLIASAKNETQPFLFPKLDISDGFWRIKVRNEDCWNFCYVLSSEVPEDINIEDIDIVVSSSLQMGWTEFSLFFVQLQKWHEMSQRKTSTTTFPYNHILSNIFVVRQNIGQK